MAELRVGEFVKASRGGHAEVAPYILRRAEVELLHRSRTWLSMEQFKYVQLFFFCFFLFFSYFQAQQNKTFERKKKSLL